MFECEQRIDGHLGKLPTSETVEPQEQFICSCGQTYFTKKDIKKCNKRNHILLSELPVECYSAFSNLLFCSNSSGTEWDNSGQQHALKHFWEKNKEIFPTQIKSDVHNFCRSKGKQLRKDIEIWLMETGIDKYGGHGSRCTCETCFKRYFATKHVDPISLCPQCQNPQEYEPPYNNYNGRRYKDLENQHHIAIKEQWSLRNIIDKPARLKSNNMQIVHYICDECDSVKLKNNNNNILSNIKKIFIR